MDTKYQYFEILMSIMRLKKSVNTQPSVSRVMSTNNRSRVYLCIKLYLTALFHYNLNANGICYAKFGRCALMRNMLSSVML